MSAKFLVAALVSTAVAVPVEQESHQLAARNLDPPFLIKKGLAYDVKQGGLTNSLSLPGSAVWAYNWGSPRNAPLFQQIPMCWGPGCNKDALWSSINEKPDDVPYILGYNEPDEKGDFGGCDKTIQQAYDAWGNDMFQFEERGIKLICPAITSYETQQSTHTGRPAGLSWLWGFLKYKNNPEEFRCSAQAIHWYGAEGQDAKTQANNFISYVAHAHDIVNTIYGREQPLWITEFAPLPRGNDRLNADFLRIVLPWLDAQDYVKRYSFFMTEDFLTNGQLNEAGKVYVAGH